MFGGGPSNLAWFQLGKWTEENAQRSRDAADILLGYSPAKVDRLYINALHAALQNAREVAGHNYELGTRWKNEAHRLEMLLADREAVIKQTDRNFASCKDTLQRERAGITKKQCSS